MVINADARVDGKPRHQVLTEIDIAGYLITIRLAALLVWGVQHLICGFRSVVGIAVDVLVVDAGGQAIALKQLCTLIPGDARQCILRPEVSLRGLRSITGSVINLMSTKVGIDAQCPTRLAVVILKCRRHHTARNPLVGIIQRTALRARVGGIEVCHVGINIRVPVVVEVVAQLHVAAILFESHTRAVVVGATVLCRDGAAELTGAHLVRSFCLHRAIAACSKIDVGIHTVLAHSSGDDIHDTAHRVRTIKYRGRTTQHLYTFGHQRLITVGNGVTIDALILRMSVNQYQQLSSTACHTTQVDAASCTSRNTVTHHRTAGHEQSRHLLHRRRQHTRLVLLRQHLPVNHCHRHRQVSHVGGVACTCYYHFFKSE